MFPTQVDIVICPLTNEDSVMESDNGVTNKLTIE